MILIRTVSIVPSLERERVQPVRGGFLPRVLSEGETTGSHGTVAKRVDATGDLSEAAAHELADELFRTYDAEKTAHSDPSLR